MRRIVVAVALSWALVAQAQEEAPLEVSAPVLSCERPKDASSRGVASQSDAERLAFLSKLLLEESGRARAWILGWGATYSVLTVAQLSLIQVFPRQEPNDDALLKAIGSPLVGTPTNPQADMIWGAVSTGVGVAFTLLDPPEVLEAGPLFSERARVATPEQTCKLIAEGERLLSQGAEHELSSTAWYLHVGNVLLNVGFGLVLALGYNRWTPGLINAGVGIAVGEATLFTAPTHLVSGWDRYRQGETPPKVTFHLIPTAGPGLGLLVRF